MNLSVSARLSRKKSSRSTRILLITLVSMLICIIVSFVVIYTWNNSAEKDLQNEIIVLDQHFTQPHLPLTKNVTDDVMFSPLVGNFQRISTADCENKMTRDGFCVATTYNDDTRANSFVYIRAKLTSEETPNELQKLAAQPASCGPENRGQNILRSTPLYQYIYTICNFTLIVKTQTLSSITWINNDWLLTIGGASGDIISFINQYQF